MGSILFGKEKNKVSSTVLWVLILLGISQIGDIFAYYGYTEIENFFITLVAAPLVVVFALAIFRVMIPIRKPIEIYEDSEEEPEGLGMLTIQGADMQTHYINLDKEPMYILKGLKELGPQDWGFWKQINQKFSRAPFKGNPKYNSIRIFTVEKMRDTKEYQL